MKIVEFKTESGSLYQVDYTNKLIRRINGIKAPTDRQGQDGNWKIYKDIVLKEDEVCFIFWDPKTTSSLKGSVPATATSKVISIKSVII